MGQQAAVQQLQTGTNVLGFGEMGIGNTSAASALLSVLTGLPAQQTTGIGTGITSQQLMKKIRLINLAQQRPAVRTNDFQNCSTGRSTPFALHRLVAQRQNTKKREGAKKVKEFERAMSGADGLLTPEDATL